MTILQSLFSQQPHLLARKAPVRTTDAVTAAMVARTASAEEANARRLRGLAAANRKRTQAKEARISNSVAEAQEKAHLRTLEEAAAALDKRNSKKGGK